MSTDHGVYRSSWQAYLLLVPTLAVLVLFLYYPTLQTLRFSFYTVFMFGQNLQFVGLENFLSLVTAAEYHQSIAVTLVFGVAVVLGTMLLSLLISFQIFRVSVGKTLYMLGAIWPYAVPPAVAATISLFLSNPTAGVLTYYLETIPGVDIAFYTNGRQALAIVVVVAIWKQIGFNVIFMLAALHRVPESLTEAARLDGVGSLNLLARVYVPLMAPTLVFLVVMNTIYAFFESFAFVDLMTQGGPNGMTNFLIYKLFRDAFQFNQLGSASAQSVILFVIVATITYIQLTVSDERAYYT